MEWTEQTLWLWITPGTYILPESCGKYYGIDFGVWYHMLIGVGHRLYTLHFLAGLILSEIHGKKHSHHYRNCALLYQSIDHSFENSGYQKT